MILKGVRSLFGSRSPEAATPAATKREEPPRVLAIEGHAPFPFADHLVEHHGLPIVQWEPVLEWIGTLSDEELAPAWSLAERAWLLHLGEALGADYDLEEGEEAVVLSSLSKREARATLEFMQRTLRRVTGLLNGIAQVAPWGKDILIVFDDDDRYYEYASYYHPDGGDYALSSGMHISHGCSHFVTTKAAVASLEPVIVHEMAHGCVTHLSLPLWLNEGIAVNTERRLAGAGAPLHTPAEMHAKHLKFWGDAEIQEFWSGRSFRRHDDGNMLSYDLARAIVEQFSADWDRFAAFAVAASWDDGGAAAAREHLGVELGACVRAMMEREPAPDWEPRPEGWGEGGRETTPERIGYP